MMMDLTPSEKRVIELLREIQARTGFGALKVEVTAGAVSHFTMAEFSEKPPR